MTVSYFYLLCSKYRFINKRIDVYTCNYTVYDSAKYVRIILRDRIIALVRENQDMIVIICEALFTLLQFGF
jgi:hypothetical protein